MLCPSGPPRADLLHLRGGRTLAVEECRQEGDELKCRSAGGVIGFPLSQVERVERQARPPLPRRTAGSRAASGALPPAVKVPLPAESRPGVEGVRARVEALTRELGRSRPRDAAIRAELSILHAWLGNEAMQTGDFEGADRHYLDSLEFDPGLMVARLNRATALINLSRYESADEILHHVLSERPDHPRALDLLGESAVRTGKIPEGIEMWERSLAQEPDAGLSARLERARRLLTAEEGFSRTVGAHFALKFDGGEASPDLAEAILDYLEGRHADLSARFAHEPDVVIQTVLYSTRAFQLATASPDWVGGLFDGQIRVPIRGITHLTPQLEQVLSHELAHCFVASLSRGNAPQWIHEGVAQLVEGRTAMRERRALLDGLRTGPGPGSDAGFSYPRALSQMEFFHERWSEAHLNELLDRLGRGTDIDGALRAVTGLTYAEFLGAWKEWLER